MPENASLSRKSEPRAYIGRHFGFHLSNYFQKVAYRRGNWIVATLITAITAFNMENFVYIQKQSCGSLENHADEADASRLLNFRAIVVNIRTLWEENLKKHTPLMDMMTNNSAGMLLTIYLDDVKVSDTGSIRLVRFKRFDQHERLPENHWDLKKSTMKDLKKHSKMRVFPSTESRTVLAAHLLEVETLLMNISHKVLDRRFMKPVQRTVAFKTGY